MNTRLKIGLRRPAWSLILFPIMGMIFASSVFAQVNHRYPRIAFFGWGGPPIDYYAKFDMVCGRIGGSGVYGELKKANPNVITFISRDWNVWDATAHGGGAPEEWFVRDSKGNKVDVGYGYLMDISNYCTLWDGKRYNEYLIDIAFQECNNPAYDGYFCEGIWDHPYGTSNVDLDKNGVNDWNEHGRPWLTDKWLEGMHITMSALHPKLKAAKKYLILNSGRFHDFEWANSNGLMLEHEQSAIFNFPYFKGLYDRWMKIAPEPHFLFVDVLEASKNSFQDMRYLLTATLMGDGYFAFRDSKAQSHEYRKYYDEYDTDLGSPTSGALQLPNGCWVRFFSNGVVITNPSGADQIVTDGDLRKFTQYAGLYYRFRGGQDPDFNNGSQFVQVSLRGKKLEWGGYGDGIILLKSPLTVVSDIIIDESDAGTSPSSNTPKFNGNWILDDGSGDDFYMMVFKPWKNFYKYGYSRPGNGENSAVYTPFIGVAGTYQVFEWHGWIGSTPDESVEATNVPYTIAYAKGNKTSGTIDQSMNYGKWNSLGTYFFEKGTNGNVTITNKANRIVIADAFKFILKSAEVDSIRPNEPKNLQGAATDYSIDLNWSLPSVASDGDVASAYQIFRNSTLIGTPFSTSYLDSDLSENTTYLYEVYSIDDAGNRSIASTNGSFTTLADVAPPKVTSVRALSLTTLEVTFNEKVEKTSAESIHNYSVETNVTVTRAELSDNQKIVYLKTTQHVVGANYTLFIENVKDVAAAANIITPRTSASYMGSSGSIKISVAADDEYELYVNDKRVGSGNAWENAQTYTVPSIAGKNVIAVKGIDAGGKAGLVVEMDYEDKHFVSDETWKVAKVQQQDWETVAFNDVTWSKATAYGLHGQAQPWASYKNVTGISTFASVQWIWSADYENDNVVYLRFSFGTAGDTTPPSPPTGITVTKK
ncbi:MAG: hypothetical protein ABIL68_12790 [bacterium]